MSEQKDRPDREKNPVTKLAEGMGSAVANAINKANEMRDKRIIEEAKEQYVSKYELLRDNLAVLKKKVKKLNKKLDDREEDLIEAKKQERERIILKLKQGTKYKVMQRRDSGHYENCCHDTDWERLRQALKGERGNIENGEEILARGREVLGKG